MLGPATIAPASGVISYPLVMRNAISMLYYTMRSLTAPLYFVLITAITYTSHRLKRGKVIMFLMWAPVVITTLLVLTNPLHHLVFFYDATGSHRGPLILVLYASSLYYSLVGMAWLLRWRRILTYDTFATLALLYPIVCTSAIIQYFIPKMRLEMFVTSVVLMLLSDFVMRPERQFDALADAASLQAYREMCERAFITDKPMCLVYTEIVSIERLRELVGKDGMQTIVRTVSINLHSMLAPGDVLYYLRNGLFCIEPHNIDANRALGIARTAHGQKRALDLPFSLVKFDKTLADGIDDPATRTVVEQSIAMMHSIGKHVLVEGVETREQVELLRAMGADYIQGFYFARPMPQDEFVAFLREHNGY